MTDMAMNTTKRQAPEDGKWTTVPVDEKWAQMFKDITKSAFRLEVLQAYADSSEDSPFVLFQKGIDPGTDWIGDWCRMVQRHISDGKTMARVHVVDLPLSDYMHFEIRCAYTLTGAAGENIRLVDRAKIPQEMLSLAQEDFWFLDGSTVMVQDYDPTGKLYQSRVSRDAGTVAKYAAIQEKIWELAVPFKDFYQGTTGIAL